MDTTNQQEEKLRQARKEVFESQEEASQSFSHALKEFERAQDNVYPENIFGMAKILLNVQPWIVVKLTQNYIENLQESIRSNWTDPNCLNDPHSQGAEECGLREMCQVYSVMLTKAPTAPQTVAFRDCFEEAGIRLAEVSLN